MDFYLLIFLILLSAGIVYYARHSAAPFFKILTTIFFIMMIATIIMAVFLFKDLETLKKDVSTKKSIFIISQNEIDYTAVGITPSENQNLGLESFEYYNLTNLKTLTSRINDDKKDSVLEDGNGRIFVFSPKTLNKNFTIDVGIALNEDDLINIIMSDEPYDTLGQIIMIKKNVTGIGLEYAIADFRGMFGPDEKLKGYILASLVINYFADQPDITKDIKSGELKIYPETISFKLIKYAPIPDFE